jgi:hypothetical protein
MAHRKGTSLPYAQTRPLTHAAKALDTRPYNPFPERSQMPSTIEQILPDREALKNVEREYLNSNGSACRKISSIAGRHADSVDPRRLHRDMERMLADRSIQQFDTRTQPANTEERRRRLIYNQLPHADAELGMPRDAQDLIPAFLSQRIPIHAVHSRINMLGCYKSADLVENLCALVTTLSRLLYQTPVAA